MGEGRGGEGRGEEGKNSPNHSNQACKFFAGKNTTAFECKNCFFVEKCVE